MSLQRALVGDGVHSRRQSADRVEGGSAIHLGGPKYSEFEVETGDPIPGYTVEEGPSTIAS